MKCFEHMLGVLVGAMLLCDVAGAADEAAEKQKTAPAAASKPAPDAQFKQAPAASAKDEPRLDRFDVDNVPLGEVAKELTAQFHGLNFIVPDAARDQAISLKLRNVTVQDVVDAIEMSTEGRVRALKRGNLVSFAVSKTSSSAGVVCRVYRLAPMLEGKSDKEALAATQAMYEALAIAWEMMKKHDRNIERPEMTIHNETRLLIAVGRERELAVLEEVIQGLQGSAVSAKVTAPPSPAPKKF